jgi:hypothetical protein
MGQIAGAFAPRLRIPAPGSCFRSPFRCRVGRDLGGDRRGALERDGRLGGTRGDRRLLLRRALAAATDP